MYTEVTKNSVKYIKPLNIFKDLIRLLVLLFAFNLAGLQLIYVYSTYFLLAAAYRFFCKLLTITQFFYHTGFFELLFKFLKRFF
jgi:hypothetical protein